MAINEQLIELIRILDKQRELLSSKVNRMLQSKCSRAEIQPVLDNLNRTEARLIEAKKQLGSAVPQSRRTRGMVLFITPQQREFEQFDKMMRRNGNDYAGKKL